MRDISMRPCLRARGLAANPVANVGFERGTGIVKLWAREAGRLRVNPRLTMSGLCHFRVLVVAGLAGGLLACASPSPEPRSGKPEVTISGTTLDKLKTALVSEMSKRKFRVTKETASEMSFEQPANSTVLQAVASSDAGKNAIERITYTVATVGGDMHVVADVAVVRKLAAMEKPIDINQSAEAQTVQSVLDKIAGEIGTAKASKP